MGKVILGNHAAVVVPRQERDEVRRFYCDVLGFRATREAADKDDLQLGEHDRFHLSIIYGDVPDESELLRSGRSIYLELKCDDVGAMRQKVINSGVTLIETPDPHLYFQAPGGQVFRLVGIHEDLTRYERDVGGDEQRNAEIAAAARQRAEQTS
jgi:catechol 2,3-dioxygenase-like lactoylglutathione lyase family enzyme